MDSINTNNKDNNETDRERASLFLGDSYQECPGRCRIRQELFSGVENVFELPAEFLDLFDASDPIYDEMMQILTADTSCECCKKVIPVRRVTLVQADGMVQVLYDICEDCEN